MKEIVQDGTPILREIAIPVPEHLFGTGELQKLVDDMAETLDRFPEGVALAAPQIGVGYRLFIVRKDRTVPVESKGGKSPDEKKKPPAPEIEVYVNPEIMKTSRRQAQADEGCLSVHGVYGTTLRHERVSIQAQSIDGKKFERGAGGLLAQIFEHEIDHLNGILFTDHAEHLIHIPHGSSLPFVFFGTPEFSTYVLDELSESGFVPALVVTSPDKPAGRGLALTQSAVKTWANERDIPVLQPERFDEAFVAALIQSEIHFAVVAAYGKILPKKILDLFPRGALNVHPSLLPRYRGTSPVESQILAEEEYVGVSVILMDEKMDHGPIVAQERVVIPHWPVERNLANEYLWHVGGKLLGHVLPGWLGGSVQATPQDESVATVTHKTAKEDGEIKIDGPARENYLKYLAYSGWPGTYFFMNGKRIKITQASFSGDTFAIERVIPEGKREMAFADFIGKD